MKSVWIVDDDKSIRWVLEKAMKRENIPCRLFEEVDSVLEALKNEQPSLILSDIHMPGKSGLDLLNEVTTHYPNIPVIIMTAYSDLDSAVSSYQGGAFEYLPKPFDINKAIELIHRVTDEQAEDPAVIEQAAMTEIIGKAPAMQEVFRAIGKLSQSSITVLLTGESGAGKEVVARALHNHSPRSKSAFIALNMAAIPHELMESELFGHEKGAFTGANSVRIGRFEQAEKGTLFLDEIGDMPSELQTRLLRVLSDGYFYRVGGHLPIKANVRVIAATHQNLEQMVKDGRFREDLYHRLNVIRLRLPPLRERKDDIPLLVNHFLIKSAESLNVEPKKVSDETIELLKNCTFPGNVRQLENLCNWLTVMAPSQTIKVSDLPEDFRSVSADEPDPLVSDEKSSLASSSQWMHLLAEQVEKKLQAEIPDLMDELSKEFEKTVLATTLKYTGGKRIEAAQKLGLGRNTITRKISELNIDWKD